jgi:hypothetical protein
MNLESAWGAALRVVGDTFAHTAWHPQAYEVSSTKLRASKMGTDPVYAAASCRDTWRSGRGLLRKLWQK